MAKRKRNRKPNPHADEGFCLARPTYKGRHDNARHKSRHWHVRFKDHAGIWRRLVAFTDRSASTAFARKVRELIDLKAVGKSPSVDLQRWAAELSDQVRGKLIEWGIVNGALLSVGKPLAEHVGDYYDALRARGLNQGEALQRRTHLTRTFEGCGITLWREITRSVVVRPDGYISLDLIGDVKVEGESVEDVRREISSRIKEFIVHPDVTVFLDQSNSRRYYVLGEVNRPGSYLLIGRVSVAQALATAGGPTNFSKRNAALLVRPTVGQSLTFPVDFDDISRLVECANGASDCDASRLDANGDGAINALDIGCVALAGLGILATHTLSCERRPEGIPAP